MARNNNSNSDASVGELVKQLADQTSDLARKEVELAKTELTMKAKHVGVGAGAFGGAGFFGIFAFAAMTAGFIVLLSTALDGWLSAFIVAAVYALIAGVLALFGKKQVDQGTPPLPEQAIDSAKADVQEAQHRAKEGKR